MSVERCENFRTEFPKKGPNKDLSWCKVKGYDTKCFGYSDQCPIVEFFRPRNKNVKRDDITFSQPPDPNPHAIPEGHLLRDIWLKPKEQSSQKEAA